MASTGWYVSQVVQGSCSGADFLLDFQSIGRFGLLVLTSSDLLNLDGESASAANAIDELIDCYEPSLLQVSILHCLPNSIRGIAWSCLPPIVKARAEMRFHSVRPDERPVGQDQNSRHEVAAEDAYGIYGVDPDKGALVAIRPDGYVGVVAALNDVQRLRSYFDGILAKKVADVNDDVRR